MKFASKLSGVSEIFGHVNLATVMPDVRKSKFSLSRPQSRPFLHPELDTGPLALTQVLMHGSVASCQQSDFRISRTGTENHVKLGGIPWGFGRDQWRTQSCLITCGLGDRFYVLRCKLRGSVGHSRSGDRNK